MVKNKLKTNIISLFILLRLTKYIETEKHSARESFDMIKTPNLTILITNFE